MKRSRLNRRTPLRSRKPMRRGRPVRARRATPRNLGDRSDEGYLAYLREQPCRAPATATHWGAGYRCDPHHARHTATGASMGAHVKDDRRALSLCREHHDAIELGTGPWKGWTRDQVKQWENQQIAEQRAAYLAQLEHDAAGAAG